VLALATVVILSTTTSAHRRDEYLQAARLGVEPARVELELDLTPGIALSDATIADIDRDRDGKLSEEERGAYLRRVIAAAVLELDGRPLHVELVSSSFPDLDAVRHGEGTIRLHAAVALAPEADGDHQLSFRNMDQRDGSVYLANALAPRSSRIVITAQRRDQAQRELTIDYVLRPRRAASAPMWLLGGLAGVAVLAALLMRTGALVQRREPVQL
jgi:hypothetical protein